MKNEIQIKILLDEIIVKVEENVKKHTINDKTVKLIDNNVIRFEIQDSGEPKGNFRYSLKELLIF